MKHTFAICAYGDSPYLETCIRSLKRQSEKTEIILCTSTPSQYVKETAKRYQIPVYVRDMMQMVDVPTRRGVLLGLVLTNKEVTSLRLICPCVCSVLCMQCFFVFFFSSFLLALISILFLKSKPKSWIWSF